MCSFRLVGDIGWGLVGDFEAVYTGAVYLEYLAGGWLAGYLVVLFYIGWGWLDIGWGLVGDMGWGLVGNIECSVGGITVFSCGRDWTHSRACM